MVDAAIGAVLIYSRVQGIWSLNYTIPGFGRYSGFGSSLAYSEESGLLVVGASYYSK